MPPAPVPPVVAMLAKLGMGTAPVIAMLDHDGIGARNRRRRNRDRSDRRDDITRLPHAVLLTLGQHKTSPATQRSHRNGKRILNSHSASFQPSCAAAALSTT